MGFGMPRSPPSAAKDPDSLRTLKVILSSEMEGHGKVIRLKDPQVADSLLRLKAPADRKDFDRLLGDGAITSEVKSPEEFRDYWKKVESDAGIRDMRAQYDARDP